MFRYRLRTLLILMAVACLCLSWIAYCRRMVEFHMQQSSLLISQVAKREGWTDERIEMAARDYFPFWPDFTRHEPIYRSVINHELAARKYDRAAWRPWVLISN